MPTIHLNIGGSTATRTLNCPGWIKASKGIAKRPAGQAAIDGSMHHEIMEMCQHDDMTPVSLLGYAYLEEGAKEHRVFSEDDLDLSNIAYNATNALLDLLDIDELEIEPFVQIIEGEAGGSIDLLGLSSDRKTILIADYKFGNGIVKAKNNEQLLFYAFAAQCDPATKDMFSEAKEIICAIIQPKAKGVVDRWSCSMKDLKKFSNRLMVAIDHTSSKTPPIKPGGHCNWCPAAPYCTEKRAAVHKATLLDAKSHNELISAAAEIVAVEQWLKDVKEELYFQLTKGVDVEGWKIVDKRPSTKWIDEDAARAFLKNKRIALRDVIKPATLMTPIQVGKILHKKGRDLDMSEFIISKSSGTTIATSEDSREAVVVSEVRGHLKDMMSND